MARRNKCPFEGPIWPDLHRVARFSVNVCALQEAFPDSTFDHEMPIGGGAHCHPAGDIDDGRPVICIRSEDMTEKHCECGVSSIVYHEVAHAIAGRHENHGELWRSIRLMFEHGAAIDIAHNLDWHERIEGEDLFTTMRRLELA